MPSASVLLSHLPDTRTAFGGYGRTLNRGCRTVGCSVDEDDYSGAEETVDGCVCAISVYRIWKDPSGSKIEDDGTLNALCSLLVRRSYEAEDKEERSYSVEYALARFDVAAAIEAWELGRTWSASRLAAMANETARPEGPRPLAGLGRATAWKALYCAAAAAVRERLGLRAFYEPVSLRIDRESGLVLGARPRRGANNDVVREAPRPAAIRVSGGMALDPRDVMAAATRSGGEGRDEAVTIAFAKLSTLRDKTSGLSYPHYHQQRGRGDANRSGGQSSPFGNCFVEITTKRKESSRSDSAPPDPKRRKTVAEEGSPDVDPDWRSLFRVSERSLRLPNVPGGAVAVTSLVPRDFDCLVAAPDDVNVSASLAVYAKWYVALHHHQRPRPTSHDDDGCRRNGVSPAIRRLPPLFVYLGPEIYPGGEDGRDYAFWPGFPGWQILKLRKADRDAVAETTAAYAATDGLWPMAGPRTFHVLAPWHSFDRAKRPDPASPPDVIAALKGGDAKSLAELSEQWPAGRIECAFPECCVISDSALVKMDFSAFGPTIYSALFPKHERLAEAVVERTARRSPWLKRPLVEFCGMLKRLDPETHASVVNLSNGVAQAVIDAAAAEGFAACSYVRDGFWGTFAGEKGTTAGRQKTADDAERVRRACERAANAFVTETAGLSYPRGVRLVLRVEGVYTDTVSWNSGCYYMVDRRLGGGEAFVGFPTINAFCEDAKAETAGVLREFFTRADDGVVGREAAERLTKSADEACLRLLETAFLRRSDPDYWKPSLSSSAANEPDRSSPTCQEFVRRVAVLTNSSLADRGSVRGDCVKAVAADGGIVSVPCSVFPSPVVLPAVACEDHAAAVFAATIKLINVLASRVCGRGIDEDEDEEEYEDDDEENDVDGDDEEGDNERRETKTSKKVVLPTTPVPTVTFNPIDYSFLFIKNK